MSSPALLGWVATAARGLEPLLAAELIALGADSVRETVGAVHFTAELAAAYRACLWSRLASRILLPLATVECTDADRLYAGALDFDWTTVFSDRHTFAIEIAGRTPGIANTQFAALKVKDAIADRFRAASGRRPSVDRERPDLRIHVHLHAGRAALSLDLAGESLHRRGYRGAAAAPLKETLAAGILLRAGWPEIAHSGGALLDPLCGSGTLVIEAALMAADVAPGLRRARFGFEAWRGHDAPLWRRILNDAHRRAEYGLSNPLPRIVGQDADAGALRSAAAAAVRAGVQRHVEFAQCDVADARPIGDAPGLVVANPPYGERLGAEAELVKLYSLLGATLRARFPGWRAAVFTARPDLGERLGLRAGKIYSLYNGALACKLLLFDVPRTISGAPSDGAEDFANRLSKNLKHLGKWARRAGVSCYRVYDADLPDYALAVDVYASDVLHLHVQEYAAPATVDRVRAERRLRNALAVLQQTFELPSTRIHFKQRRRQRGKAQYEKQAATGAFHVVEEHGVKLWVNLDDYLDTGLFLDHRPLRRRLLAEAAGKRFLNLFCYTATATVHAARGGAARTVSVDLSKTYLDWAARNLALNGFEAALIPSPLGERVRVRGHPPSGGTLTPGPSPASGRGEPVTAHALIQADCMQWLHEAENHAERFDLILCDPPTFSNSKRMTETLDVQRDHVELIRRCAALLAEDGTLYFSTNRRGFKLDREALAGLAIEDITVQTIDEDFHRGKPHQCLRIRKAS